MPAVEPPTNFELPEDLTALTSAELEALETDAVAAFDVLRAIAPEDLTDDDVDEMERLSAAVASIRTAQDGIVEAVNARQARAEQAMAAMATPDEEPADEVDEADEDAEDDGGDAEDEVHVITEVEAPPQQVAASARPKRKTSVVRSATRKPVMQPASRNNGTAVLTAANDIPDYPGGSTLDDLSQVALAFESRASAFSNNQNPPEGIYQRYPVAKISRGTDSFDGHIQGSRDFRDDYAMLLDAAKEQNLPDGSLTASGGWCAPSETIYDLCTIESLDGLLDLPEINVNRGGIRFTTGPDFSAIYATAGFCVTEAQAIAGTPDKPCVEVTCPTFEEVRLDACGICVKAPILTNAGYPELVQRWIEGTIIAQQHKVNAKLITAMLAQLPAPVTAAAYGGVAVSTLSGLELAGEGLRQKWRMSRNATLEVVGPMWGLAAIRADLALRTGQPLEAVSDQQINAHFAARKMRVQWVYDWQPLTGDCPVAYPATAQFMIYPAGTFVKGVADVISLDTIYDTADLVKNMYTAAFAEEGVLLAQVCHGGCVVNVPVCISGQTGAADIDCLP